MQEYPEDIVILADDDMFYPYDTIKNLYNDIAGNGTVI